MDRFYVKPNLAADLIAEYVKNGGTVKTEPASKAKVKTFLNHSYRGTKARTLRSMGYAKGTG